MDTQRAGLSDGSLDALAELVLSEQPRNAYEIADDMGVPALNVARSLSWLARKGLAREVLRERTTPRYVATEAGWNLMARDHEARLAAAS